MEARFSEYLEEFRKSLEGWTDERMITRQQLDDLTMFNLYIVNLADDDGWVYNGHSLSYTQTMCRLVVRGTINDLPYVVFSTGRTPTGSVRAFLRKMDEGRLEWSKDKYR